MIFACVSSTGYVSAEQLDAALAGVDDGVGGARIAVARLADRRRG